MVTGKQDTRRRETHTHGVVNSHPEQSAGDEENVFASGSSVNPQIVQGPHFGPINFTIVEDESAEDESVDESGRAHLDQMLGRPNREERVDSEPAQHDLPAKVAPTFGGRTIAIVLAGVALLTGLGYLALF